MTILTLFNCLVNINRKYIFLAIISNKETRTNFGELQKGELHYQVGDRI